MLQNQSEQVNETHLHSVAYSHFEYHAKQRTDMFQHFLSVFGILFVALSATLEFHSRALHILDVVLSVIMLLMSIVFKKLDGRNKFLIEHAELVLKNFEKLIQSRNNDIDDKYQVFTLEEIRYKQHEILGRKKLPLFRPASFSSCMKGIFYICGGLSVLLILLSVVYVIDDYTHFLAIILNLINS